MRAEVNVVVVSWNALDYLKKTVDSLFEKTDVAFCLTIIDNDSRSDVVAFIDKLEPQGKCQEIIKIVNETNLGYTKAVNEGLVESLNREFKYICFCNNDLYFANGWLGGLLSEMKDGVVAAYPLGMSSRTKLHGQPTREIFEQNKLMDADAQIDFLARNDNEVIRQICKENHSTTYDRFPQFLPDHCVLVDAKFIGEIGYWADERFGIYGSNDVDICWEIFKRGGKIKETNKSFVYHFRHKSLEDSTLDRTEALTLTSKILYKKWQNEIESIMNEGDFWQKFFDLDCYDYTILRLMNEKIHYVKQSTTILAVFGGLGKTVMAEKYPRLCSDIEVTNYRYDYGDMDIDHEKIKGTPNRKKHQHYPNNYIVAIGEQFNQKALITLVLSGEILQKLDRMGIRYGIVYPKQKMKNELLGRMRRRGNNIHFLTKIERILDEYGEIGELQKIIKPQRIYYADNTDTLEDVILRDGIADSLDLSHSTFEYKGVKYYVRFYPHQSNSKEEELDFTQVYCVGNIDNKALVIYHEDKNGQCIFNLPGGTREPGENLAQNLRREMKEETNCEVLDYKILGVQINSTEHGETCPPQVRVFAHLRPYGKFVKDPGGGVKGYELIPLSQLEDYIGWGEVGDWLRLKLKNNFEEQ